MSNFHVIFENLYHESSFVSKSEICLDANNKYCEHTPLFVLIRDNRILCDYNGHLGHHIW